MDYFQKYKTQVQLRIFVGFIATTLIVILIFGTISSLTGLNLISLLIASFLLVAIVAFMISGIVANAVLAPLKSIWDSVLYIDPNRHGTAAPKLDDVKLGHELTVSIVQQIYQLASQHDNKSIIEHRKQISQAANIVEHMPLPLFVFNKDMLVTNASASAISYCRIETSKLFGAPIFDSLILEFVNDDTLEKWAKDCQENKVTDTAFWERVHVLAKSDNSLLGQCDIAAYYNKDNSSGAEFIVTLFDKTERYNSDDDALGFVALAVHELRTPITMLRGYIEVFQSELGGSLNDELKTFMLRMESSAKHLSAFVSNILNVAKIEQNQLILHLKKLSWPTTMADCVKDAELRAKVFGKTIEFDIQDDLPDVAVDPISMYEVMNNLLENAIKYSGKSDRIIVKVILNKDGNVETTVQDFGDGIPMSVLPNLFEKFSRNHRTKAQVSGTGLGLFLSRAIINAHGGNIWASSKEREGSTFGFTLIPYDSLSDKPDQADNKQIERSVNGWIKNHSLYKR